MCNPNVPSVTLQTAILMVVKEFATNGGTFSAHSITKSIRDKCNNGQMEIPEIEDTTGADSYRFNIDHASVRQLFNEMRDNGVFDADYTVKRRYNGMYYEYTATPCNVAVPVPNTATPTTPPQMKVVPKVSIPSLATDVEIDRRVMLYLKNCETFGVSPTLKNIQSAIKRGKHSTGISKEDISSMVTNMGYSVFLGNGEVRVSTD